MGLTVLYGGAAVATGQRFFARICRLDTKAWLDSADLSGATWQPLVPIVGWELATLECSFELAEGWEGLKGYGQFYSAEIPTPAESWPDGLEVAVFLHDKQSTLPGGRNVLVGWQTARITRSSEGSLVGEIRIPVEVRQR